MKTRAARITPRQKLIAKIETICSELEDCAKGTEFPERAYAFRLAVSFLREALPRRKRKYTLSCRFCGQPESDAGRGTINHKPDCASVLAQEGE